MIHAEFRETNFARTEFKISNLKFHKLWLECLYEGCLEPIPRELIDIRFRSDFNQF